MPTSPSNEILHRIPIPGRPDQELHLRLRTVLASEIPPMYEWSLYNTQGGGYVMAVPFPPDSEVLDGMIAALQEQRRTL